MDQPDFPTDLPQLAELDDSLAVEYHRTTAVDPRLRRLQRALADLGLPVPSDWATYVDVDGNEALRFSDMPWSVAQRFVALLEDLAERRPVVVTQSSGPSLFDAGPAPAPQMQSPAAPSTAHIELPR